MLLMQKLGGKNCTKEADNSICSKDILMNRADSVLVTFGL